MRSPQDIEQQRLQHVKKQAKCQQYLDFFGSVRAHEFFEEYVEGLNDDLKRAVGSLEKCNDMETLRFTQGQIKALRKILSQEERTKGELDKHNNALTELEKLRV